MIIDEKMEKELIGMLPYWAQGIVYCYDKMTDKQLKSMIPGLDIEKKIEKTINDHDLKQYEFYQGVYWAWHVVFDSWQYHRGLYSLDVKLKALERALEIYQYSNKEMLIYKDINNYWKKFGVMYHE